MKNILPKFSNFKEKDELKLVSLENPTMEIQDRIIKIKNIYISPLMNKFADIVVVFVPSLEYAKLG